MILTFTANSPIRDMVLKYTFKELMSANVAKTNLLTEVSTSLASVTFPVPPVKTSDTAVTNPTPAITATTVATALKYLRQPCYKNQK